MCIFIYIKNIHLKKSDGSDHVADNILFQCWDFVYSNKKANAEILR